jgi:hypothetical protein
MLHPEAVITTSGLIVRNGMNAVEGMAARHMPEMTAAAHPAAKMMRDVVGRIIGAMVVELANHDTDTGTIVMLSVVMTSAGGMIGKAIAVDKATVGRAMVIATTGRTTVASADHSRASVTDVKAEVATATETETVYGNEMMQCRRVIGTSAIAVVVLTTELLA